MRWLALLLLLLASCAPRVRPPSDGAWTPARVLRHRVVLTGEEHEAIRTTWRLARDGRHCELERTIEKAPPTPANGEDDASWTVTERTSWRGPERDGGRCELAAEDDRRLVLRCEHARLPILPSGTLVIEPGGCVPSIFPYAPDTEDVERCVEDAQQRLPEIRHPLVFADDVVERVMHETTCGYGGSGALRWATSHDP